MIRNSKSASEEKKWPYDGPSGFILSDAAQYAYVCQDIYSSILEFASAIPPHLQPLFLIPIKMERIEASSHLAGRIASLKYADGPTSLGDGGENEADWFGTKTFKYEDNEPTIPNSDPGSIFDIDGADSLTHHQEYNFDENIQVPTDTSYMNDVDMTQYWDYPYRTKEKPIRHSFTQVAILNLPWRRRVAIKPAELESRVPEKIKRNSQNCRVSLTSYDKKTRVFTFSVVCGHGHRKVQASLSDVDKVALSCDCPFWRYNGPEFHASNNSFMLGQPFGTAAPPDVRDPDSKYFLCKHAYSVLRRLDDFVQEIAEENWDKDDEDILEQVDEDWDRLEGEAEVPTDDLEDNDIDIEIDWEEEPEGNIEPEPIEEDSSEEDESQEVEEEVFPDYEVDLSDLEPEQDYEVDISELDPEPDYEAPEESADYQAVEDALNEEDDEEQDYEVKDSQENEENSEDQE